MMTINYKSAKLIITCTFMFFRNVVWILFFNLVGN